MKTLITDPIAATSFALLRPDGTRAVITVMIGRPYVVDEREARCPLKIDGLEPQFPDIGGNDTLQALALALRLVRTRLFDAIDRGDVLADPDTNEPYDSQTLNAILGSAPLQRLSMIRNT